MDENGKFQIRLNTFKFAQDRHQIKIDSEGVIYQVILKAIFSLKHLFPHFVLNLLRYNSLCAIRKMFQETEIHRLTE